MGQGQFPGRREFLLGFLSVATAIASAARGQTPPGGRYTLKTVSLTGPGYEYVGANGIVRGFGGFALLDDSPIGPAGTTAGENNRHNASGAYLGDDSWFFNGSTTQLISPTGGEYEYSTAGGTYRSSQPRYFNAAGDVTGVCFRFSSAGDDLGQDAWLYNSSTTQRINPIGGQYEFTSGAVGQARNAEALSLDSAGGVTGSSTLYIANNTASSGSDVWHFNGSTTQVISPTSAPYQYTTPSLELYRSASLDATNAAGQSLGDSQRYSSTGAMLGSDAWRFNGTTTTVIGLTGGTYEYTDVDGLHREGHGLQINASGQAVGRNLRFSTSGTPLGHDLWFCNGSTTQQIGLTGGVYEFSVTGGTIRSSNPSGVLTNSGKSAGVSNRYGTSGQDLGIDAWRFDGTSQQIGLIGAGYEYTAAGGTYRVALPTFINEAGHVLGQSLRYSSGGDDLGVDIWVDTGAQSRRVNLTGAGYEYTTGGGIYRQGDGFILTSSGKTGGHSLRFAPDGTSLGSDAWMDDGSTTRRISLTGAAYEKTVAANPYREGTLHQINDITGAAIGDNKRYAADGSDLGQAGWFFDAATDQTLALEFSFRNDGYSYTDPQLLSDTGVVLGSYDQFSGASTLGLHVFWWSKDDGFHDLGSLVNGGGPAGSGWSSLISTYDNAGTFPGGSPQYILGVGKTLGEDPVVGFTAYELQAALPEPAGATLALAAAAAFLTRRYKINRRSPIVIPYVSEGLD